MARVGQAKSEPLCPGGGRRRIGRSQVVQATKKQVGFIFPGRWSRPDMETGVGSSEDDPAGQGGGRVSSQPPAGQKVRGQSWRKG